MKNKIRKFFRKFDVRNIDFKNINYKKVALRCLVALLLIIGISIIVACFTLIYGKHSVSSNKDAMVTGTNVNGDSLKQAIQYNGKKYQYNQNLINILILGIDNANPMSSTVLPGDLGQSDAIYLLTLDTKTKNIRLVGIPRDTMVPIKINSANNNYYNMESMQITLQYAYGNTAKAGTQLTANAVSALLYNIPINRVIAINLNTISLVNDAIGGVEVQLQNDMTDEAGGLVDDQFVKGNTVKLTGKLALEFVQERDCSIFASSMDRVSRQEQYFNAFLSTAKAAIKNDYFLPLSILKQIEKNDYAYTNMSAADSIYLSSEAIKETLQDITTIPGDVETVGQFEEFHVDNEQLKRLVVEHYYTQVK